jgi:hypothetical protein
MEEIIIFHRFTEFNKNQKKTRKFPNNSSNTVEYHFLIISSAIVSSAINCFPRSGPPTPKLFTPTPKLFTDFLPQVRQQKRTQGAEGDSRKRWGIEEERAEGHSW